MRDVRARVAILVVALAAGCSAGGDGGPGPCGASLDDGNPCTIDTCDAGTGVAVHAPVAVEDGNLCTVDACDSGTGAISHLADVDVDDGDACTLDLCAPASGIVTHPAVELDDSDLCTADSCDPASGVAHAPVDAADAVACTIDACDALAGVSHVPSDALCDDANVCSGEACSATLGCQWSQLPSTAKAALSGSAQGAMLVRPAVGGPITGSYAGYGYTFCPVPGPNPTSVPPTCAVEMDFGGAVLAFATLPDGSFEITGTVPLRMANLPIVLDPIVGSNQYGALTFTGNQSCTPADQAFMPVPVTVRFDPTAAPGDALTASATVNSATVTAGLSVCGGGLFGTLGDWMISFYAPMLESGVESMTVALVEEQLCAPPPCPVDTTEVGGKCRYNGGAGACVSRGLDPVTRMLVVPGCAQ
jgi:hypothetical protein